MYLEKDSVFETAMNISPNNHMHTDKKSTARASLCFLRPVMRTVSYCLKNSHKNSSLAGEIKTLKCLHQITTLPYFFRSTPAGIL